MEEEKRI
jgi:hypothetical protein